MSKPLSLDLRVRVCRRKCCNMVGERSSLTSGRDSAPDNAGKSSVTDGNCNTAGHQGYTTSILEFAAATRSLLRSSR